jgi:low temperature requirement protein LtrA
VAVLGLTLTAGLWWTYFAGDEEGAERALSSASTDRRWRLANDAYFYAYIPIRRLRLAATGRSQSWCRPAARLACS